jgi:hypothetical protein
VVAFEESVYFNKGLFIIWAKDVSAAFHYVLPEIRTPEIIII